MPANASVSAAVVTYLWHRDSPQNSHVATLQLHLWPPLVVAMLPFAGTCQMHHLWKGSSAAAEALLHHAHHDDRLSATDVDSMVESGQQLTAATR